MENVKEVISTRFTDIVNDRLKSGNWILLGYEKVREYRCVSEDPKEFKYLDEIVWQIARIN